MPERPHSFLHPFLPYFCAALVLAVSGLTYVQEPTQQELLNEVRALRAEVKELRGQLTAQTQPSKTQPTKEEQARTAADVMHDASVHHNVLDVEGFTAGHDDRGFIIQMPMGDSSSILGFSFRFAMQRITGKMGSTMEPNPIGKTDLRSACAKLTLDGNVFTPDLDISDHLGGRSQNRRL